LGYSGKIDFWVENARAGRGKWVLVQGELGRPKDQFATSTEFSRNSKYEYRNSKQMQNPNYQNLKLTTGQVRIKAGARVRGLT